MKFDPRLWIVGFCLAAALAIFAFSRSSAQPSPAPIRPTTVPAAPAPAGPVDVSLIQLIATPDSYDGKTVRLQGFVRIEFEGTAVYLHREDAAQMLTRNGLWLDLDPAARPDSKEAQANNHYATIEGRFNAKAHGHLSLWSGALEKITRMTPSDTKKDDKEAH